jgi:hypothetical protein
MYCERQKTEDEPAGTGYFAALRQRFSAMLRAAEEGEHVEPGAGRMMAWLQARMLPWVAERIAEQRLLWNLRGCTDVVIVHPDDLPFDQVMPMVRQSLRGDAKRHLIWLIIDTVLLGLGLLLTLVPGPNLIAYFFAFRVVGHWLSMRGANQGLKRASWSGQASPVLTAMRSAVARPPHDRDQAIEPLARELGLARLTTFVDRMLHRK